MRRGHQSKKNKKAAKSGIKKKKPSKPYKGTKYGLNPGLDHKKETESPTKNPAAPKETPANNASKGIRLNKYVANAGICSRREADIYIESGAVWVNGKAVTEMGYQVGPTDAVSFDGQRISPVKKEYVLLNKPKGFISTTSPEKTRTVMDLVSNASKSRLTPIGRLERNTTGLLLFTNDDALLKKLTNHEKSIRKIYHVELDRSLRLDDLKKIEAGIKLPEGFIQVDEIAYAEKDNKRTIGIQLQSNKNGIIRKLFEHLHYDLIKIDRVIFAGLTKKELPRGHWRILTNQEVINLKMM